MYDMGKVIKEQRMLQKMTQEQVAYALNISAVTVGRWENNYKTPSLEHMDRLSRSIQCIAEYDCRIAGRIRSLDWPSVRIAAAADARHRA